MCMAVRPPSAMLSSNISSEVARAAMMPSRAAALMAITLCMTSSPIPLVRRFVGKLLMSQRFRTSAPIGKNGFITTRIVSPFAPRRNIQRGNASDFNEANIGGGWAEPQKRCWERASSPVWLRLVAGGREQIAAAADGADHGRLGRVRFDLAADPHDP